MKWKTQSPVDYLRTSLQTGIYLSALIKINNIIPGHFLQFQISTRLDWNNEQHFNPLDHPDGSRYLTKTTWVLYAYKADDIQHQKLHCIILSNPAVGQLVTLTHKDSYSRNGFDLSIYIFNCESSFERYIFLTVKLQPVATCWIINYESGNRLVKLGY